MQRRPFVWFLVSVLCLCAGIWFWRLGDQWQAQRANHAIPAKGPPPKAGAALQAAATTTASPPLPPPSKSGQPALAAVRGRHPHRLSNTSKTPGQLARSEHALLLANALLDTSRPVKLAIPDSLKAPANNGSYVVQATGPLDDRFRSRLAAAGATIVSYVPNDAYLVRMAEAGARQLAADPQTQGVLPYEPYYKLEPSLLRAAVEQAPLPADARLNATVFADARAATLADFARLGAEVLSEDHSPFGPVFQVRPAPDTLAQLAVLAGVQALAPVHGRVAANDLARPRLGVAADSVTLTNYLGLSGSNVLVDINDTGVDATHPDLAGRLTADLTNNLVDTSGHGTHVAGTILGGGRESMTVTNAQGSLTNASFRGLAYNALGYVVSIDGTSDGYLQEQAALTNALISNNSWNYDSVADYDLAAASYDAAVRDALPGVSGPQPVLFVFSAGNGGNGDDTGLSGDPESILSPGTAKNVITVGALEQPRFITNLVVDLFGNTNLAFLPETDSDDQVAGFSGRGNVGIGIEGDAGRFKPDVVAPGTFVVSDASGQWDQAAYYNPTNDTYNSLTMQSVDPSMLAPFSIFVPQNAVQLIITVVPNAQSPSPFPPLPIYLRQTDNPTLTAYDFLGTNQVSLPPDFALNPGSTLFYSVGNNSAQTVGFDVQTELVTTNDNGNYFTVLSNLNSSIGPWYRYETGTSMAAAGVSGLLACMQEFFQGLNLTSSPALLKALLINGARSAGPLYDLDATGAINYQGWGLPSLPNSIPGALTNLAGNQNLAALANQLPVLFFDQSPAEALATGQGRTRLLQLSPGGQGQPLRVTLVWTDPPGNPVAGIKLVNNLGLVVTNLDTGEVFFGNDIPSGGDFNQSWDTHSPPNLDLVNNVQNVYLSPPLGTNYSVTVLGRRVNVNAVTANTNGIVQDYALVMSSGDAGAVAGPFLSLTDPGASAPAGPPAVGVLTNGVPLFGQRAGASSQYAAGTNGTADQWNFYVFTNTAALTNANFTNVAFVTFLPPELGVPRLGTAEEADPANATRPEADIDLYVSTNPALTNLDPAAMAGAQSSVTRTGTEKVLYTNSAPGQVYYLGVRSQDQQGGEFGFLAVATDQPFGQTDANGNVVLTVLTPVPVVIPGGSPANPSTALVLAVTTQPARVRQVLVTESVTHPEFGDLIGTLIHGQNTAVLNNHSFFTNPNDPTETLAYDDSGEAGGAGARKSDGPGSLRNFAGDNALSGVWILSMVNDSSLSDVGSVNSLNVLVEPQPPTNNFFRTLPADSWFFDFVDVPAGATNLSVSVSATPAQPVDLYLRRGGFPSLSAYDAFSYLAGGSGSLAIGAFDSPPLNPGRYYFGVFNPNNAPLSVNVVITLGLDLSPVAPFKFLSAGNEPLLDDAVTFSTNHVGIPSQVVSAEVGVRIDHPRESDLVLTLVSPQGTRVLLAENRGGLDTNGYGSGFNRTNVQPQTSSGNGTSSTNVLSLGTNTTGTLIINYDFFTIPDDLRVYYEGQRIFDSGVVGGSGTYSVDFGPGSATNVVIIMNQAGNGQTNSDLWTYDATVITTEITYATFTEDTNKTTTPIKFAPPPFGAGSAANQAVTAMASSFEGVAATNYTSTTPPGGVDGWTVLDTNPVTVVTVTALADTGTNVLALHNGGLSRLLPTVPGQTYTLTFVNHGRPLLKPVGWWKGEDNYNDSSGNNNTGTPYGFVPSPAYLPAVVGDGFNLTNCKIHIPDQPLYTLTDALSIEGWVKVSSVPLLGAKIFSRGYDHIGDPSGFEPYSMDVNLSPQPGECTLLFSITDSGNNRNPYPSAPLPLDVFQHVAGTYGFDGTNRVLNLYINGVQVGQAIKPGQPIGALPAGANAGLGIGGTGGIGLNESFNGVIDEITLYSNELSQAQVQDIYAASYLGKCSGVVGACRVTANVTLAGVATNTITGVDSWTANTYTFIATTTQTLFSIQANEDGMLLDSFQLQQNPTNTPGAYFLPEESLAKVAGENCQGDWVLEVLDNRAGATNHPVPMLVSWQLSLVLNNLAPIAYPLSEAIAHTNTLGSNSWAYFSVDVPAWATYATNILTYVSGTSKVNLLFNQSVIPGTNATDVTLLTGVNSGTATLTTNGTPPLVPGRRYYLGVTNVGTTPITFSLEVDFNITPLTNGIPITSNVLAQGSVPRYYQYDVSAAAASVVFETYGASGNLNLVASLGAPLPDLETYDYLSANPGSNDQAIVVITNSSPVALTPGRWYIGVFNLDVTNVSYSILAQESGPPTIITLTNGVPFDYSAGPGLSLSNFFRFVITETNAAALFELYNLSGNVDLTLQRGAFPSAPPFFDQSMNPGTNREQIVIRTNILGTNINGQWFLGVPNNDAVSVTYTIRAVVSTNGLLISAIPIQISLTPELLNGTTGPTLTWPAVDGETYEVQQSIDLVNWETIATVIGLPGDTIYTFIDPIPISNEGYRFYRIIQIPGM